MKWVRSVVPMRSRLRSSTADNFGPVIRKYNSFLMENHGLVVMSPDSSNGP